MTDTKGPSYACAGESYLSVGRAEPDDPLAEVMECNAGPDSGDCGWSEVVQEWSDPTPDGTWDVAITSTEFLAYHARHLAHSARRKGLTTKCHCGLPVHTYDDGFSRGMCEECSTVRCDVAAGPCTTNRKGSNDE